MLAEAPDVVIVATGGLPDTASWPKARISRHSLGHPRGEVAARRANVLLYDDNGAHPGVQAPSSSPSAGARLELVTPERIFAPEIGGTQLPGLHARLLRRARRADHARTAGCAGSGATATGSPRSSATTTRAPRGAPGRPGGGRARHPAARRALLRAQGASVEPGRGRLRRPDRRPARRAWSATPTAASSCSGSATPSPAATSTPRSTTRCACARPSECCCPPPD